MNCFTSCQAIRTCCLIALQLHYVTSTFLLLANRNLQDVVNESGIQVTLIPQSALIRGHLNSPITVILFPNTVDNQARASGFSIDGIISYFQGNLQYNYTLVSHRAYLTIYNSTLRQIIRNECITPQYIPPLSSISNTLLTAKKTKQPFGLKLCPNKLVIEFRFAGEPYWMCMSHQSKRSTLRRIQHHKIEASIQLLYEHGTIIPDRSVLSRPQMLSIDECLPSSDITPSPFTILNQSTTLCKFGLKSCIFLHGLGEYEDMEPQDDFTEYWGNLHIHAHCCWRSKFLRMDITRRVWYDDTMAAMFCKTAKLLSSSPLSIEDVAVIAHSAGNMVVANALLKQMCQLGSSAKWIALGAPLAGSPVSVTSFNMCNKNATKSLKFNSVVVSVLRYAGFCPLADGAKALISQNSWLAPPELKALYDQVREVYTSSVTSVLCGMSPFGLSPVMSIRYWIISAVTDINDRLNDGVVEFESCRGSIDKEKFQATWSNTNYYRANINHADSTMKNGDGWWSEARKPLKWFLDQF